MHTLVQLKSGELSGIKRLSLAENLSSFPLEILSLRDSLEILDLSNNQLSTLPDEFKQLNKLKIIFASNNCFESLPEVLGQCQNLEMVGFKTNKIRLVPENALPQKLRWLILTDNLIETLPDALGQRPRLQKLALAGNRLSQLPPSLANSQNLELIRISANQLTQFPTQLFNLPKLAWLAFSGNPFSRVDAHQQSITEMPSVSYKLQNVLGQGASGVIYKAQWAAPQKDFPAEIAVKVFKGEVTTDGYPEDELSACLKAGHHPNLVKPLAQVKENNYLALIMNLIPPSYQNLGLPPCLQSCTRDRFPEEFTLSIKEITKIVAQMESILAHLQANQVCHGDLYAHNTLFDDGANILFGDFGAASIYHMLDKPQQAMIEKIEQRAFHYFIDDLLSVCSEGDQHSPLFEQLKLRSKSRI